jgi:hypothetical protein
MQGRVEIGGGYGPVAFGRQDDKRRRPSRVSAAQLHDHAFGTGVPDAIVIAGLGMVGAAAIAFAIISAGDAISRGYTAAWVVPRDGTTPAKSALLALAEAYSKAHTPPAAEGEKVVVSAGVRLKVRTVDGDNLKVIAVEITPGTGKVRYLVAGSDKKASWVDGEDATVIGGS